MLTKVLRGALAATVAVTGLVVLTPTPAQAASVTATLKATRLTSVWGKPSPDPSGITYRPDTDRLIISDSEVEETPLYAGANLFVATLQGAQTGTQGTSLPFSKEPTGAAYKPSDKHLFLSDDDANRVFEVRPGADNVHGTPDDTVTSFSTQVTGNTDAEGVSVDLDVSNDGHVYVVDGTNNDVFDYFWGANQLFDGVPPQGDDTFRSFDVGAYGAADPEGIEFDPVRNTILVLEHKTKKIYEVTRQGQLLNIISISAAGSRNPAGLAIAPASDGSGAQNLYIVDRGVDNNVDPNENDGKFYEMSVTLPPLPGANTAPVVNAGTDQSITLPASASLDGTVTDDGQPNPTPTTAWTVVSGPGTVTFGNAAAVDTTASFSAAGTYVLRLTANDGSLSASDDVTVTVAPTPGNTVTLDIPIRAGSDDAETLPTRTDLTSDDLELVADNNFNQTVGLRFTGVTVPQGATITNAYVQFQVDEVTTNAANLRVVGQAADNAATFTTAVGNITNRPKTTASVGWVPPGWSTVGERGANQRTPNVSSVIQEIVSRPGWISGRNLALIITGSGRRTAESFEGGAAFAPVLHIEYSS